MLLHEAWPAASKDTVEINMATVASGLKVDKNQLAPARIYTRVLRAWIDTYCLIDPGATTEICSGGLARALGLHTNQACYDTDVVVANRAAVPLTVYDVALDVKGIIKSKVHVFVE